MQTKNPFDEILSLSFDLGPLKVNTYGVKIGVYFAKDCQNDSYNKTHLMGKKLRG